MIAFWFAGLPGRMAFAPFFPLSWAVMEHAAYARHALIFGDPHERLVRAFYRGRI